MCALSAHPCPPQQEQVTFLSTDYPWTSPPNILHSPFLITLPSTFIPPGTITGLRNYGAFLELDGGMAGLLHISQISYDRVDSLETLFTIGQRCKVSTHIYTEATRSSDDAPLFFFKDTLNSLLTASSPPPFFSPLRHLHDIPSPL